MAKAKRIEDVMTGASVHGRPGAVSRSDAITLLERACEQVPSVAAIVGPDCARLMVDSQIAAMRAALHMREAEHGESIDGILRELDNGVREELRDALGITDPEVDPVQVAREMRSEIERLRAREGRCQMCEGDAAICTKHRMPWNACTSCFEEWQRQRCPECMPGGLDRADDDEPLGVAPSDAADHVASLQEQIAALTRTNKQLLDTIEQQRNGAKARTILGAEAGESLLNVAERVKKKREHLSSNAKACGRALFLALGWEPDPNETDRSAAASLNLAVTEACSRLGPMRDRGIQSPGAAAAFGFEAGVRHAIWWLRDHAEHRPEPTGQRLREAASDIEREVLEGEHGLGKVEADWRSLLRETGDKPETRDDGIHIDGVVTVSTCGLDRANHRMVETFRLEPDDFGGHVMLELPVRRPEVAWMSKRVGAPRLRITIRELP